MKIIQLKNAAGTIIVDYLTDLIGSNNEFTVYQIKQVGETGTGSVILSDEAIQAGYPVDIDESNLSTFRTFAVDNNLFLYIYETGEDTSYLVYNGEAIGSL